MILIITNVVYFCYYYKCQMTGLKTYTIQKDKNTF